MTAAALEKIKVVCNAGIRMVQLISQAKQPTMHKVANAKKHSEIQDRIPCTTNFLGWERGK